MSGTPQDARPADGSTPRLTGRPIGRRAFLVAAGGAIGWAALRPHEAWARKARGALPPLQPWSLPDEPPANPVDLARAILGAGVLAPSLWNTQPWRMEVDGATLRLIADPARTLPACDPDQRGLLVSLGASLENMLVAMRAWGLRPAVTYFPHGERGPVAEVSWTAGDLRRDRALFAAIPERRTNRRNFDGRGIVLQNRGALIAQVPDDLRLHWIDDRKKIREIGDLAHDAAYSQVRDAAAQRECRAWMRFGDDDERRTGDGVTVEDLEFGGPADWFAGRYFNPDSWFLRFGAGSAAKRARESIRSSGALALLAAPRRDETLWLAGGQAYERFALKATQLGIAHHPLCAAIQSPGHRADALRAFDAAGEEPLMLVRLGGAKRPKPSARRSVALVASFRNS